MEPTWLVTLLRNSASVIGDLRDTRRVKFHLLAVKIRTQIPKKFFGSKSDDTVTGFALIDVKGRG